MRGISEKNILDEFCIKFCKVLEKQCRYIVVSGFVAISSGRSRATEDIDIIIEKLDLEWKILILGAIIILLFVIFTNLNFWDNPFFIHNYKTAHKGIFML